ncbi:MAG: hypothetical protein Q4B48_03555, partial [Syntrophomonadaceae bacterium]|nr:hypothetical protein [Syntrophomonadaceae bacterium]
KAKMLAGKGIFAKPSMAQPRAKRGSGEARKTCAARISVHIIPCSKNACWQGHFCKAVNGTAARQARVGRSPKNLRSKDFCAYYTTANGAVKHICDIF